jgi:hypothetical protein
MRVDFTASTIKLVVILYKYYMKFLNIEVYNFNSHNLTDNE